MRAKYVVKRVKTESPLINGQFYFSLIAANGETLAVGEGYGSVTDAKRGIKAHRRAALSAKTVVEG